MNRRRLIKTIVGASVCPTAVAAAEHQAAEPVLASTTYQSGWYIDAPVYTTVYLAPDRKSLVGLIRKNPRLATWRVIPIGSQFLVEEPCEGSLARVAKVGVDYRVDEAVSRKLAAQAAGDLIAAARHSALIRRLLRVFPRGESV